MVVGPGELIQSLARTPGAHSVNVFGREDEAVYSLLPQRLMNGGCAGRSSWAIRTLRCRSLAAIGTEADRVRILVRRDAADVDGAAEASPKVTGYVRSGQIWVKDEVIVVPIREALCCRFGGLLETDRLADKRVFAVGVGSGGAPGVVHLVQSGVMRFDLMDPDRLEVGNIMRHPLGLSDVGRYKTKAMADFIRDKNPYAEVRTWEEPASWDNLDLLRELIREADVVLASTDNRISKIILNRLCVEEGKVVIIGTAFRRAYGGQVLRVRPGKSLCYQCFLQTLPEQAKDQQISSAEQAAGLAYTDRLVPIEPGLSLDIAPIPQMQAKLALMESLRGTETTFSSLYEDLVAPLYIWTNRREQDTDYANLEPLEFNIDGMHVMRWYGVAIGRDPACPVCGDFEGEMAKAYGITVTPEDVQFFGAASGG